MFVRENAVKWVGKGRRERIIIKGIPTINPHNNTQAIDKLGETFFLYLLLHVPNNM